MNAHILQPLWKRAQRHPEEPVLHWRDVRGRQAGSLSVGEAVEAFCEVARGLRERGLSPGDRVMLAYPPSLEFIIAFGGCLWAGVLPVPTYPPMPDSETDLQRLATLADTVDCKLALTSRRFRWLQRLGAGLHFLRRWRAREASLEWWVTSDLRVPTAPFAPCEVVADDDAFLQFTSGSTSQPKGVRITHGNLAHQLAFNRDTLGLGPDTRAVLWVPQYHDLGLISGILSSLSGNGEAWFMSPLAFLRDPGVWFDVATEVRGTHTAAPDFAFDYLMRRTTPERRQSWDLSSMRVVMSAAEPITPTTVRAFYETLAPAGLRPESFCAAYGLAEHTVGVTTWGAGSMRLDKRTLEESGCAVADEQGDMEIHAVGAPARGISVRIVDPDTHEALPDGRVGEVWVDSPSKAVGYWGLSEQSALVFEAQLQGRGWLRTGDLGFVHQDQLYITGRIKDLIIVQGRNIASEDVERSVRSNPHVRRGGIAAFALREAGRERIGLVVEARNAEITPSEAKVLAHTVLEEVSESWPLPVSLALTPPKSVLKTTSGKVRRADTRTALLNGELSVLVWASNTEHKQHTTHENQGAHNGRA